MRGTEVRIVLELLAHITALQEQINDTQDRWQHSEWAREKAEAELFALQGRIEGLIARMEGDYGTPATDFLFKWAEAKLPKGTGNL